MLKPFPWGPAKPAKHVKTTTWPERCSQETRRPFSRFLAFMCSSFAKAVFACSLFRGCFAFCGKLSLEKEVFIRKGWFIRKHFSYEEDRGSF